MIDDADPKKEIQLTVEMDESERGIVVNIYDNQSGDAVGIYLSEIDSYRLANELLNLWNEKNKPWLFALEVAGEVLVGTENPDGHPF